MFRSLEHRFDGDQFAQRDERRLGVHLRAHRQRQQIVGAGAESARQFQHDIDGLALVRAVQQRHGIALHGHLHRAGDHGFGDAMQRGLGLVHAEDRLRLLGSTYQSTSTTPGVERKISRTLAASLRRASS